MEAYKENIRNLKHNMFFNDMLSIYQSVCHLLDMDDDTVDQLLDNGHGWALDHISTANSELELVYHFLKAYKINLMEDTNISGIQTNNYMFFQNLKTLKNNSYEILNMDINCVDDILSNHDWMSNLVAKSNDDVEEVYHFLMSALDGYEDEYAKWSEPMKLNSDCTVSNDLKYHLENNIALGESVFRYGSDSFIKLINEVKNLYSKDLIKLNENDRFIVNDFTNEYTKVGKDKLKMDFIFQYEDNFLNEAEYQGKNIEIGKPKRGGSKKFYVYVKNPKNGNVKKVSFGAKSGGGKLAVKLRDPKARKAFADRHNCEQKNDKTKPGYWACRLPRYAKLLGLSGGGKWW